MSDLDPSQAASLEDLAVCLRQLHLLADKPTYRTLEQRTLHASGKLPGTGLTRVPLRRSTLSEALQGRMLPGKAFFLTFVEACDIELETDLRWEKAWNRVALQHQAHAPEVSVAQLYEQLGDLRRQLAEAEQRATSADNHELVGVQETAAARLNLVIRRAEVAESLLQWERKQSRSRFTSVCMPELDEGMTEGTVACWFKKEGDLVEQDELLVQITTPTRVADHACPIPGAVRAITVAADTTAAVGTVLAVIEHDPARDLVRVLLPYLGKSATGGVITRWLKKEGERVEQDEPLLELATNLADIEIPSPAAGILRRIVAAEDETVAVGAELGVIGPRGQQLGPPGGSVVISMPQLGEKVTEGTVIRWLKKEGEPVEQDEPLLEVSTDKVDTEIPSPVTGILRGIVVAEDETVAVGSQLGLIDTEVPPAGPGLVPSQGAYITPLVRKLAAEHGVDLSNVEGTGVYGRIRKADVLDAARALRDQAIREQ